MVCKLYFNKAVFIKAVQLLIRTYWVQSFCLELIPLKVIILTLCFTSFWLALKKSIAFPKEKLFLKNTFLNLQELKPEHTRARSEIVQQSAPSVSVRGTPKQKNDQNGLITTPPQGLPAVPPEEPILNLELAFKLTVVGSHSISIFWNFPL